MNQPKRRDVTTAPDSAAITALVMYAETVYTGAGEIVPDPLRFTLCLTGSKPKRYRTALPAVRALRRASN